MNHFWQYTKAINTFLASLHWQLFPSYYQMADIPPHTEVCKQPCDRTDSTVPSRDHRPPLADCCTTPPAWSHDRRVCRHTCTDKGSGGVPTCFSTQQAFLTQSISQSMLLEMHRVPLKRISKPQQWDAFKCCFFFFFFSVKHLLRNIAFSEH